MDVKVLHNLKMLVTLESTLLLLTKDMMQQLKVHFSEIQPLFFLQKMCHSLALSVVNKKLFCVLKSY